MAEAVAERDVVFAGRLGSYRYYNMDQVVAQALMLANRRSGSRALETSYA